jgi:type I restriction enzyme S subunit
MTIAADSWIEGVPVQWTRGRIKNLIASATNGTWGGEPAEDGTDVRCIRAADFDRVGRRAKVDGAPLRSIDTSSLRQHLLHFGDLILEKSGGGEKQPVGMAVLYEGMERAVCSNFCSRISPAADVDSRFLAYVFAAAYGQGLTQSAIKQTTGIQNLDARVFFSSPWAYPGLDEQRRIADFLDAETSRLDDLARTQVLLIERLKEREGVAIELTLRSASSNTVRLKHLLTAPMSYGANESTEHNRRDWPRYIRTTDIAQDGTLRDETFASLPPDVARNFMLSDGDLLFVRSGATVGKSFVYKSQHGPAAHAGYLIRARVNDKLVLPRLIWYFCQTSTYWQQISEGTIQATIQNVNAERYGNLLVPLVDVERQKSTLAILDSQLAKSRVLQHRASQLLDLLDERRQALITAAVTGQFDVSTASGRNVTDGVTA